MNRPLRIRLALAVLLIGSGLSAWLFMGVQVGSCLGPLGVTQVQCVEATGIYPTAGWGTPMFAVTLALAANVLLPGLMRPGGPVAIAALGGAAIGASAYLAFRPLRLEGLTSYGEFLSLPLPVDPPAVVAVAVATATASVVGLWLARRAIAVVQTGRRAPAS